MDEQLQILERSVKAGDSSSRQSLGQTYRRCGKGKLLLWRGIKPNSDNVIPLDLVFPGYEKEERTWALPVMDMDDLFTFLKHSPNAIYDAATQEIELLRGQTPFTYENYSYSTSNVPALARRIFPGPLYDREIVGNQSHYPFFSNSRQTLSGHVKFHGKDTNMYGNGGYIPANHTFVATTISLIPDTETPYDDYDAFLNSCTVRFVVGQIIAFEASGNIVREGYVLTVPITIQPLTTLRVNINVLNHLNLSKEFGLTVSLGGWSYRGFTG